MIESGAVGSLAQALSELGTSGVLVGVLLIAGGIPLVGGFIIAVLRNLFARSP